MKAFKYKYPRVVITTTSEPKQLLGAKDITNPDELDAFINLVRSISGLKASVSEVVFHDTFISRTMSDIDYRKFYIDYHAYSDKFSMVLCEPGREPEFNGFVNSLPQALNYIDQYWFDKVKEKKNEK